MEKNNDYKGFALFNDIEDVALRNRNRAVVLANLAEDNVSRDSKKISPKGASLILGYFSKVPEDERADVHKRFVQDMNSRGFVLNG